jgi:hypothetical protein
VLFVQPWWGTGNELLKHCSSGQNNNNVEIKDFNAGFWKVFHDLSANGSPNHFPWLLTIINSLPDWMSLRMGHAAVLIYKKV